MFIKPKKSLGQNFLIDRNVLEQIVDTVEITNKEVLEIGPGSGNLTTFILKKNPKKFYVIEKDDDLALLLQNKFSNEISIINDDVLKISEDKISNEKITVFGNLPYNVSTKILASLILLKKWPPWYDMLVLMFQKEVADRIIAKANTKEFGRLSVLANWRLEVKKHFDISNNCFFPKPKIMSTVLSFKPIKNNKFNLQNPKNLEKITRILFSNRRKMINKNFRKIFKNSNHVANELNINLKNRPSDLSNEIYYKIAIQYENYLTNS